MFSQLEVDTPAAKTIYFCMFLLRRSSLMIILKDIGML